MRPLSCSTAMYTVFFSASREAIRSRTEPKRSSSAFRRELSPVTHVKRGSPPLYLIHGDSDPLVPLSYSERAQKAFPHAVLTVLKGQGHGFRGAGRRSAMEAELSFILENLSAAPGAENASPD